jgi:hypothetical protein
VLSGRGLCEELITRPEESYRLCCVVVCDLETSRIGAPYIYDISHLRVNSTFYKGAPEMVWITTILSVHTHGYKTPSLILSKKHTDCFNKNICEEYLD